MTNSSHTNVIYDRMTGRVIVYEKNGTWAIPSYLDLAHFENGVEPVFRETKEGDLYLKPNAMIINGLGDE